MKYKDLVKELRNLGWFLLRQGGNHEVWTNGNAIEYVPRHKEIKENTARTILKTAKANPGK